MERKLYGRYIVTDPDIYHGRLTFRGTSVFVADVLADVARGLDLWATGQDWPQVSKPAIAGAVRLACQAFVQYADEYVVEYGWEKMPA